MSTGWKYALGFGAVFIAFKLWSDSKRLSQLMKEANPGATSGLVSVGGVQMSTPVASTANPNKTATSNVDANPSTAFDSPYFQVSA